jgi:hypothetical protein
MAVYTSGFMLDRKLAQQSSRLFRDLVKHDASLGRIDIRKGRCVDAGEYG